MLIHKLILQALKFAVASKDARPCLTGYGLSSDGAVCVTDGHLMLYSEHPSDEPPKDYPRLPTPIDAGAPVNQVLPLPEADAAMKGIKGKQTIPILNHVVVVPASDGARLRVASTNLESAFDTTVRSEDQFPNWRRVVPTKDTKLTILLGADMLIAIGRAAKTAKPKAEGSTGNVVRLEISSEKDGIRISFPCDVGGEILGVAMPCRP